MMEIISSITTAIQLAKKVKEASDLIKESEFKLTIADLISQLAEIKITVAELLSENSELKSEITKLKKQKEIQLTLIGDVYMKGTDGPFCTTCWDKDNSKIRLKEETKDFQGITGQKYICPVCRTRHLGNI